MAELEKELLSALEGLNTMSDKPCGCHDKVALSDDFMSPAASSDLAGELDRALSGIQSGESDFELDSLAGADDLAFLEFASLSDESSLGLDDVIAAAERYPGLKITFSF